MQLIAQPIARLARGPTGSLGRHRRGASGRGHTAGEVMPAKALFADAPLSTQVEGIRRGGWRQLLSWPVANGPRQNSSHGCRSSAHRWRPCPIDWTESHVESVIKYLSQPADDLSNPSILMTISVSLQQLSPSRHSTALMVLIWRQTKHVPERY